MELRTDYDILSRSLRRALDDAATREVTITIIVTPEDIKNDEVIGKGDGKWCPN